MKLSKVEFARWERSKQTKLLKIIIVRFFNSVAFHARF